MIMVIISLLLSPIFPLIQATGIEIDVKKGDQVTIESQLKNPGADAQDFVYIVQIEHEVGYVVFIGVKDDIIAGNEQKSIDISWNPDNDARYEVKTFVISSFETPILLSDIVQETMISIDGERVAICSGSAKCFVDTVTEIIDGDTLDVGNTRIRLALVNTPEIGEEGYNNAKSFTSTLCPVGSPVRVDQDDGQLVDVFGRMVAKVTCGDNEILNAELLINGHAGILMEYCDESEFSTEDWAQDGCIEEIPASNTAPIVDAGSTQTVNEGETVTLDGRDSSDVDGNTLLYSWEQTSGPPVVLMNANTARPSFTAPSVDAQTTLVFSLTVSDGMLTSTDNVRIIVKNMQATAPPPQEEETDCDPSYPTVCIPSPPPDLDCGEISYTNFKVLQPDPHRFDGDKDEIGCET